MSETDIASGGGAIETAADTRPRAPLPARCYACGTGVLGPYCHACGQKNDDCRRSIWRLGSEAARDLTQLDGRFLKTVRSVVTRPGQHLREYGDGRRSPYTPPVRFFLVATFLFFATLFVTDRQIVVIQPQIEVTDDGRLNLKRFDGGFFVRAGDVHYDPAVREAVRARFAEEAATAAEEIGADQAAGEAGPNAEQEASPTSSGTISWGGREFAAADIAEAMLRVAENPRAFNTALDAWIPRLMLLLVPLMALLGAMVVRGRDALIYDHLLLSLNTHAVAFGVMTLGLWLGWLLPGWLFAVLFFVGVPAYYARALRGATGRRRRKVIVTTLWVFAIWLLALLLGLVFAVLEAFQTVL